MPGPSGGGPILLGQGESASRYSLPEAISKIQMYAMVHKMGQEVPSGFLVFKERINLWVVGFKGIILDLILGAIFTPFSLAVMHHLIPIFGTFEPNMFDKVYACILSGAYPLGFNAMLAFNLGNCYFGRVPVLAIRTLLGGFISANIIKVIFLFMWFHLIPDWLNARTVGEVVVDYWWILGMFFEADSARSLVSGLMDLKEVFIRSWYLVVGTTVVSLLIPFVVFAVGRVRAEREYALNLKYDVI